MFVQQPKAFLANFVLIKRWTFNVTAGYNKLLIGQFLSIKKGSFVSLNCKSNLVLSIDTVTNSLFSDYYLNGTNFIPLNSNKNWKLHFNSLTTTSFYQNLIPLNKYFEYAGSYTTTFSSDILIQQRNIVITNCKFYHLFIQLVKFSKEFFSR